MGRNLNDIIESLPPERQTKIATIAQSKVDDMIASSATLTDFRKAVGKTQAEVAKELGINQNAVSQLEKRSDNYVSTLRRFMKSLGLTLELSVVDKNGSRIALPNFIPSLDATSGNPSPHYGTTKSGTSKAPAKVAPARRARAKKAAVVANKNVSVSARRRAVAASSKPGGTQKR